MRLSVIIPTIDEYETVRSVVGGICTSCLPENIAEIKLIVPTSVSEKYVAYLHSLIDDFPEFTILVEYQNRKGIGAAVYEGFYSATGDYVAAIGADTENNPRDIAKMIEVAKLHPGAIVTASRRLRKGDFDDYPFMKRLANISFQTFLHIVFSTRQSDITYMFQCTPKEYLYQFDFSHSVDSFVQALAFLPEIHSIPFYEIPSKIGMRPKGKSHIRLKYYAGFARESVYLLRKN